MLLQVILFELRYRFKRPATYLYFFICFLFGFLAMCWPDFIGLGAGGQVKYNGSFSLYSLMGFMSILPMIFISSAVMGVPVVRDYEHNMEAIIFSTNISKPTYLLGRYFGSFIILLFISTGALFGAMLGPVMPWVNSEKYLSGSFVHYFNPFATLLLSSVVIQSLIFFAGGVFFKRMLYVYLQGIVFVVLYIISQIFFSDSENLKLASLVDPSGFYAFRISTRYWTIAEKNTNLIPFTGQLLYNKLLWFGIGFLLAGIAYGTFKFRKAFIGGVTKIKRKPDEETIAYKPALTIEGKTYGKPSPWLQFISTTKLYVRDVTRSLPFIGIILFAIVIFIINATYTSEWYGSGNYPVTGVMLQLFSTLTFYTYIILVYYSGELVWREKDLRMDQIYDSTPTSDLVRFVSKVAALMLVFIFIYAITFVLSIGTQVLKGYYRLELSAYAEFIFNRLLNLFIVCCVSFFIQSVVKNKFVGFALTMLFLIIDFLKTQLGVRHPMLSFNSGDLGLYSDMNGFSADWEQFFALKLFWLAFALLLLIGAIALNIRGTEFSFRTRLKQARLRFTYPVKMLAVFATVLFIGAGAYCFYQINVVKTYYTESDFEKKQARYETDLKKYRKDKMPEIVEANLKIDLQPEQSTLQIEGYYYLKNVDSIPLQKVYVTIPYNQDLSFSPIAFDKPFKTERNWNDYRFTIYLLQQPLQPGDSIKMNFKTAYASKGIIRSDYNVLANGMFFNNYDYLPVIGYYAGQEISDDDKRKKHGLKERDAKPSREDPENWKYNLFQTRARIRLETQISTAPDQVAIAPGYLQKEWTANNRRYFKYKMDVPIFNFYSVVSARYKVKEEDWNGTKLQIFYHQPHSYNLSTFFKSVKASITYNTANYSPYQYQQLRIIEFPRYRAFAQSFPNTVPYSEGLGFIYKVIKDKGIDMAYYLTAHEVGHQWWGHQVCEANARGGQMISESLSQYSALMALEKVMNKAQLKQYLKYELDSYLRQRAEEKKAENPITLENAQPYIYYQKGSLVFYAMKDYIGEDKLDSALHRLNKDWAYREDRYITTDVFMKYIDAATPDSLKYLVNDLFNKITFYDNKVLDPTYKKIGDEYEVTIPVSSAKFYADSLGNETKTILKDLIPIGVFGKDKQGNDSLLAIQKVWIKKELNTFAIRVKQKPEKAGIDPINILIDRDADDNLKMVEQAN